MTMLRELRAAAGAEEDRARTADHLSLPRFIIRHVRRPELRASQHETCAE